MEEMRKNSQTGRIVYVIAIILIVFSFLIFMSGNPIGFIGFISAIGLLFVGAHYEGKANGAYKEKYIRPLLSKYFENVEFTSSKGLEKEQVYLAELFSKGNRYSSNDLVRASYKGKAFTMSDVHIENVTHSGKHTHRVEYFKGKWIIVEFPKSITGRVKVREKGFFGDDGTALFSDLKKVETESVDFNEKFGIRSLNEIEAFYILTPHFMEALLKIEERIEGTVGFAFFDNQIHIGLYTHNDDFELSWSDEFSEELIKKHENELVMVTWLLDTLFENQKLFEEE